MMFRAISLGERLKAETSTKTIDVRFSDLSGRGSIAKQEQRASEFLTQELGLPTFVHIYSLDPLRYAVATRPSGEIEPDWFVVDEA